MTLASRRLARRCRERLATEPNAAAATTDLTQTEPPTTVEQTDLGAASPQENVDATT
jgi:hypothetical protein